MTPIPAIRESVIDYCAKIGADSMLVQGAGGNVSWKDNDTLWVKASGTWLADAKTKDIFVPVDLTHLRIAISNQNFFATPKVVGTSTLRPSIETFLHALMPHKIVVHLHAVEILSILVRVNPLIEFERSVNSSVKWSFVDYFKPGSELAQAVASELVLHTDVDVIFLRSHGVVIGGESIASIETTFQKLVNRLENRKLSFLSDNTFVKADPILVSNGYRLCNDNEVNQLAINMHLSERLANEWVLYPDHAVFLGSKAFILQSSVDINDYDNLNIINPAFIFHIGSGIYESQNVSDAQRVQLRCYFDVIIRQSVNEKLLPLTKEAIAELLIWDAEKYRQLKSMKVGTDNV